MVTNCKEKPRETESLKQIFPPFFWLFNFCLAECVFASMASKRRKIILALVLVSLLPLVISIRMTDPFVNVQSTPKEYEVGDYIPLFANKVRPINDSCESYPYFRLPFCPPGDPINSGKRSMEEVLSGECFTNTQYELKFNVDTERETLCEKYLTGEEVAIFRYAVRNNFEYHLYYDNMLLRGPVGKVEYGDIPSSSPRYYLFRHINFYPIYYGKQVKDIRTSYDDFFDAVDITEDADADIGVNFTYSVFWEYLDSRVLWDEYSVDKDVKPIQEHGDMDIAVPFILCIISTWFGLLLVVTLAYLRNYSRRSSARAERDMNLTISQGIHGEGCRCPPCTSLLGAFLGNGTQQLIVICTFLVLSYRGVLNPCNPKAIYTYLLPTYCFTSAAAGYVATAVHTEFSRIGWKECIFQTGVLYNLPSFLTYILLYVLERVTSGFSYLPYTSIGNWSFFLLISGLSSLALLFVGGITGCDFTPKDQAPCATARIQRHISEHSWFLKTPAQMLLGGLLPFSVIFLQMDDIYAILWKKKVCGGFQTMLTSFIAVILLTICFALGMTRYQLSKQDHEWWWRSALRGGSSAIFMFAYGIYFYARTGAKDFGNIVLFMSYNACIFYAVFLTLGTIGYFASSVMFELIYLELQKSD